LLIVYRSKLPPIFTLHFERNFFLEWGKAQGGEKLNEFENGGGKLEPESGELSPKVGRKLHPIYTPELRDRS